MKKLIPILVTIGTLVTSLLIVEFYGLAYWGELAIFLNISIFIGSVASLKLENAIYSRKSTTVIKRLLGFSVTVSVFINLIFLLIVTVFFDKPLLVLISLSTSFLNVLQAYNLKKELILHNYLLNGLYTFVPYLQILFFKPNITYLGTAYIVSFVVNWWLISRIVTFAMVSKKLLSLSNKQLKFTFPQTFVNLGRIRLIYIILPLHLSTADIGLYNLIERVGGVVSSTCALIIRPLYIRTLNKGIAKARNFSYLLLGMSIGLIASFGIVLADPFAIEFINMFNVTVTQTQLVSLLLLAYLMSFLNWADKFYEYFQKQKALFLVELIGSIFILSLPFLMEFDLIGFLSLTCIFYIFYNLVTIFFMRSKLVLVNFSLTLLLVLWIIKNTS